MKFRESQNDVSERTKSPQHLLPFPECPKEWLLWCNSRPLFCSVLRIRLNVELSVPFYRVRPVCFNGQTPRRLTFIDDSSTYTERSRFLQYLSSDISGVVLGDVSITSTLQLSRSLPWSPSRLIRTFLLSVISSASFSLVFFSSVLINQRIFGSHFSQNSFNRCFTRVL